MPRGVVASQYQLPGVVIGSVRQIVVYFSINQFLQISAGDLFIPSLCSEHYDLLIPIFRSEQDDLFISLFWNLMYVNIAFITNIYSFMHFLSKLS